MDKKTTIEYIERVAKDYFGEDFKDRIYFENSDYNSEISFIDDLNLGFYIMVLRVDNDCFMELRSSIFKEENESDLSCGLILDHDLQAFECNWNEFIEFILDWEKRTAEFKKELLNNFN